MSGSREAVPTPARLSPEFRFTVKSPGDSPQRSGSAPQSQAAHHLCLPGSGSARWAVADLAEYAQPGCPGGSPGGWAAGVVP